MGLNKFVAFMAVGRGLTVTHPRYTKTNLIETGRQLLYSVYLTYTGKSD